MSGKTLHTHNVELHHGHNDKTQIAPSRKYREPINLRHQSESFRILEEGIENSNISDDKCAWLRSQLIGKDMEFDTPFGKRILTYADQTASGRCLRYIEDFIVRNVLPFYGNTHTSDSHVGYKMTKMVHEAAAYIKSCMGGGPDDALLFCGSGSTAAIKRLQEAMGIAVPSTMRERVMKSLRDEEKWVVFVGPHEHHSNLLSWRQSLAELVEIGLDSEGLVDMEGLKYHLESSKYSNRPMLGSFSACSNVTGIHTDTHALARLLHQHGAFACFDFAASGPYVEIDMKSGEIEGYDAVFLSPHKFVGGPSSPGILLMSKALYQLRSSPPSTCGGGTVSYVNGFEEKATLYYDQIEEREDAGTPPILQKIRSALAFWVKEYISHGLIESCDHAHSEFALKRLLPNPNIQILGNTRVTRHPIISFLIYSTTSLPTEVKNESKEDRIYLWAEGQKIVNKPLHGRFVAKLLNDLFGIQARGGCACAGPYGHYLLNVGTSLSLTIRSAIQKGYEGIKPGWTRISFSYYMSKEELEFIVAAIEFIAIYGQRFLPLYRFNWKTGDWSLRKNIYLANAVMEEHFHLSMTSENDTVEVDNDRGNGSIFDKNVIEVVKKYASYLETAKDIANSLPKYPPQRQVPNDIDLDLVLFRI